MSKTGVGVHVLPNGKFSARVGLKELGEFETLKEAATAYNTKVSKIFAFPVYNKNGDVIQENYEGSITVEEVPVEFNKPLKDYLKQKELETQQQEVQDDSIDLNQVLDTLQNE